MRKIVIGLLVLGLLSGAAYGAGTIKIMGRLGTTGTYVPSIDLGATAPAAARTFTLRVYGTYDVGYNSMQAQVGGPSFVTYAPAVVVANNTLGPNMNNYFTDFKRDVTGTTLWAGWLEGDPATGDPPTQPRQTITQVQVGVDEDGNPIYGPAYTLYPLPGGPLPMPLLGAESALGLLTGEHVFATSLSITVPAGSVYPIAITPNGKLFDASAALLPDVTMQSFMILPEPVSALLLLAGLPLLRRRR